MIWQIVPALLSGGAVGFSLGLIGGGGSMLAVPLLLYVVGVPDVHLAIGTSALAVSINAFVNLFSHWRAGTVRWRCALLFGSGGALGAAAGSTLGKLVPGQDLLFLFALVMVAAGIAMLQPRAAGGKSEIHVTPQIAMRLVLLGLGAGFLAGFFGIGGGFLIVPGIVLGSGLNMLCAIGSSLFAVGIFGLTTATNYALSGLVDWRIAAEFVAGGAAGGVFGMMLAVRLASQKRVLNYIFAAVIFSAAGYILLRAGMDLFPT